jgi:hypothetical protein
MNNQRIEYNIPDEYEPVWPNDPTATHAICRCERHELVLKDANSHICNWIFLREVEG